MLSFGYRRQKKILSRIRAVLTSYRPSQDNSYNVEKSPAYTTSSASIRRGTDRSVPLFSDFPRYAGTLGFGRGAHLSRRDSGKLASQDTPGRRELSLETFGRHDFVDRQMVYLARLAFDLALRTRPGKQKHPAPEREEHWIRKLFERAVGGFYSHVLDPEYGTCELGNSYSGPLAERAA